MTTLPEIRFDDGEAYERYMGRWSQPAGLDFLAWLQPPVGARWLDVGCGNGAFTQLLLQRCAPAMVDGIDPSAGQLAHARGRVPQARFHQGDAMDLPFGARAFDAAVMPLVIFFVPEPARGVAEMARVVAPGGSVSAYAWDMHGGGFPYHALQSELKALGVPAASPPSPEASRLDELARLWTGAGLTDVRTTTLGVQRTFADFDDYWATIQGGPSVQGRLEMLSASDLALLRERMRGRLAPAADGRIVCAARANAVAGRVPA